MGVKHIKKEIERYEKEMQRLDKEVFEIIKKTEKEIERIKKEFEKKKARNPMAVGQLETREKYEIRKIIAERDSKLELLRRKLEEVQSNYFNLIKTLDRMEML